MSSGQTPPGVEAVRDVRVTSYPGQSTGWAAMSKDVREFDEEKVQSCKDDVDTLLVFAGLFSAVLSAFLVAAYPNLQPSPMAIMNYNLERIAMQTSSYNFTDGKLISTTSLPISPPPFQASPEDIRVNILWFSSLILSLMTASFGMLVKQWLREFLAVNVPSPQARLRIRHFREPQLRAWMVYEIVACLPLLLQLSLGLFFVGLCYFTASVHESVGHTTLPLVIGWALFFFGATTLPIFLPQCPYRTTLLKTAIAHLHHRLSELADRLIQLFPSRDVSFYKSYYCSDGDAFWNASRLPYLVQMFEPFLDISRAVKQRLRYVVATLCTTIHNALVAILLSIPSQWRDWWSIISPLFSRQVWYLCYIKYCVGMAVILQRIPKEEQLVKEASSDVEILKSVDAIQANDDMLETTFREALLYIHPKPEYMEILGFIFEILSHRLPTLPAAERVLPEWPFDVFAPLSSLRPQARTAVSNIIADHASGLQFYWSDERPDYTIITGGDQQKFTSIYGLTLVLSVFASEQEPKLSSNTLSSISSSFEQGNMGNGTIQDVLLLTTSKRKKSIWQNGTTLLTSLTRIWKLAKPKSTVSNGTRFFGAIQSELSKLQQRPDEDFDWNSWSWPEDASYEFQDACMEYLHTLVTAAPEHLNLQDNNTQEELRNVLACSSRLIRTHSTRGRSRDAEQSFQQLIGFAMRSKLSANMVITCWMSADNAWKEGYDQEMIRVIVFIPYNLPEPLGPQDLELLSSIISKQLKGSEDLTQSLKLCYHIIYLLFLLQAKTAGVEKCRELFVPIISHIGSLSSCQPTEQGREETQDNTSTQEDHEQAGSASELAKACLDLMAYEQGWGDYLYAYWKEYFHADSSIFPDDLVEALGRLIVGQGSNKPHHLRQLEERRQQSKSTEDSDVGVQSDDEGKDIPGRPSTGVGNTDQEDSANNKTMEIYDTREGLVGLALGDERSVGLEGVTGTEDTHADFAEALIDHGAAPSVSSSHDVATSVLADTKDKISDAPNEEANVNETAASGAPAILGHVAPHEESSGSGQESLTENGEGSALTDQEVARNDVN